jgi:hypothetical protein
VLDGSNVVLLDQYGFENGTRDDLLNNYKNSLNASTISSSAATNYLNTVNKALGNSSAFYKKATANYFDETKISLSLPIYLKNSPGSFTSLTTDEIITANCATILKHAEIEFASGAISLKDNVNEFISQTLISPTNYEVGDLIDISDYAKLFTYAYDQTCGAMLSDYAPTTDYKNASSPSLGAYTTNVKVVQDFGTTFTTPDESYAAGDIYPGYKLQLKINKLDYTSNSQFVGIEFIPGVIPTNSALDNTV